MYRWHLKLSLEIKIFYIRYSLNTKREIKKYLEYQFYECKSFLKIVNIKTFISRLRVRLKKKW